MFNLVRFGSHQNSHYFDILLSFKLLPIDRVPIDLARFLLIARIDYDVFHIGLKNQIQSSCLSASNFNQEENSI